MKPPRHGLIYVQNNFTRAVEARLLDADRIKPELITALRKANLQVLMRRDDPFTLCYFCADKSLSRTIVSEALPGAWGADRDTSNGYVTFPARAVAHVLRIDDEDKLMEQNVIVAEPHLTGHPDGTSMAGR